MQNRIKSQTFINTYAKIKNVSQVLIQAISFFLTPTQFQVKINKGMYID